MMLFGELGEASTILQNKLNCCQSRTGEVLNMSVREPEDALMSVGEFGEALVPVEEPEKH